MRLHVWVGWLRLAKVGLDSQFAALQAKSSGSRIGEQCLLGDGRAVGTCGGLGRRRKGKGKDIIQLEGGEDLGGTVCDL